MYWGTIKTLFETQSDIAHFETQNKSFHYERANAFRPGWLNLDSENNLEATSLFFPDPIFLFTRPLYLHGTRPVLDLLCSVLMDVTFL